MAVREYECMFLLDSSSYAQNPPATEEKLKELLDRCGAEIVASAPWQDGKLAYPIEGRKKGLHYLTYLKMDGSKVAELGRLCKLSDLVLRHLIIDHSGHGPLFQAMADTLAQHGSEPTEAEEKKPTEAEEKKPAEVEEKKPAEAKEKKEAVAAE